MDYGYKREVSITYDAAVARARDELKKEGFGVLTEIDVRAKFKEKLGVDFDRYIILGACNPPFALKALQVEIDAGLVMPCNVVVYENKGKTYVVAARPTMTMNIIRNPALESTAVEVERKLKAAVDSI
jgi:uncharacterized protein (DUF302 family)